MERTIVLYHGNCPDGFAGAYAAWKKFGGGAEYRAVKHGHTAPTDLAGAHLYFIDFVFTKEEMDRIVPEAASIVVLDHHEGVRDVVEAIPDHIYDAERSGATIAWSYFHPDTPVPYFLTLVEMGDRYLPMKDEERALLRYVYAEPFTFERWDVLVPSLEDPAARTEAINLGKVYADYFNILSKQIAERAELVSFEGMTVYLVSAPRLFASDLGAYLRKKQPPLALIARVESDGIRVSMRGDGSIDLTKIAQKYGGNGHPNASAFSIPLGAPVPWTPINESPRD